MSSSTKNNFDIPSWSGKPPPGLHLDVLKDGKLIHKLMIDEKKCYFFGRNRQLCDIIIDHDSCSRVHAVLLWHKALSRPFFIDLGATHGTFLGSIRLEAHKPQQVFLDSEIRFGASSRGYIIRARPDEKKDDPDAERMTLSLPETETELDNLTEFNTAHNRRIAQLVQVVENVPTVRRKRKMVSFRDEDDVINPEDIDPSVGKFRNLVKTSVIPSKRRREEKKPISEPVSFSVTRTQPIPMGTPSDTLLRLGLRLPNLAPDVDLLAPKEEPMQQPSGPVAKASDEPKKKKYAKEAWPGKKSMTASLFVP